MAKKSTKKVQKIFGHATIKGNNISIKNIKTGSNITAPILFQARLNYTPKISIIIPVFNVEEYVRECLDSVTNQTLKEIEIICVDDGSNDKSLDVLKEYAKKDNRITLVAPEHIGTGYCRNIALSLAKGEYIGFVDPDDWIEQEYFEKLYNASSEDKPDIVFQTSRIEFHPDGKQVTIPTTQNSNEMAFRFNIVSESGHLWSKIFKRSFIKRYNLTNSYTRRSQDLMFTIPALFFADKIKCIDTAKYYYRKGHVSVTSKSYFSLQDAKEQLELYKNLENKILHHKPQYAFFVKYKRNLVFKTMYKEATKELRQFISDNIGMDYYTDFECALPKTDKTVAIKNPSPVGTGKLWWGDYWLGLDLEQSLKQNGFSARTDYIDEWNKTNPADINFVIRGPSQFNAFDYNKINILYMMSKMKACSQRELDNYDIIIVASERFKNIRKDKEVYYLPQFTNSKRFYPEYDNKYKTDILFVGNAYNRKFRASVKNCVENDLPISVYGNFWDNLIDEKYIKGTFIDNNLLHKYYSSAAIVLNDTTDEMRENGIISNRIFDVTACKGFVISDYVPEIKKLYGNSVPMYKNEKEFVKLVKYYLKHPEERKKKAEKAYKITLANCTNTVFAKNVRKIVDNYNKENFKPNYRNILSDWYQRTTRQYLNLDRPKTFNEKIQWLKLYDSTPIKTRLADKYLVRDWVKEKIGEQYLIPLFGVYDSFDEIDFDKLPDQFVIKCNHGCGYNIIVKDKNKLNLDEAKEKIAKWMAENFAFKSGLELHYRDIKPKIIIEKFIENKKSGGDLYDYKFWCFNGKVAYIQFLSERNTDGLKMAFYDKKWKKQNFVYNYPLDQKDIEKPSNLDEMIKLAEKLSKGFNYVRVDFYRMDDGTIYFGEMTFTSASGTSLWNDKKIDYYFGSLIKLPHKAYNIETGEYYKIHINSLLKNWLSLPYYFYKKFKIKKLYSTAILNQIKSQLTNYRIDIKNIGNETNDLEINSDSNTIMRPKWFADSQGIGSIVSGTNLKNIIKVKALNDGILRLSFKSIDKRVNGEKLPLWIDYKSIKIDGKEILSEPISTWHDKPYRYEIPVKCGQEIILEAEQQYHQYQENDLKDIIFKLNPDNKYIKNNINQIINRISKHSNKSCKFTYLDTLPKIEADCFIPLGFKCQSAYQLRKHNLRFCSLPFDWIFDVPLYMFIDTIKKGISCWMNSYSEIQRDKKFPHKAVKDLNNNMIFLHDFPLDQSVEEYMTEFKEKYDKRISRMIDIIKKSKKICLVCHNRKDTNIEFFGFLKKLHEIYPHKIFYLLHVKHSETEKNILKYPICKNVTMYCVNAWNKKENDYNDWGNDDLWDNVCKTLSLPKVKQKEKSINDIFHILTTYCIDIKNYGSKDNGVKIKSVLSNTESPGFFSDDKGIGKRLLSHTTHNFIKLCIIKDGKLIIDFRGQDKRVNGEKLPLWIDYKSIKIDGKEILSEPVSTWHDKPYRYETLVKDGQEIILEVEQQYHKYKEDELKDIMLKLNLNDNLTQTTIKKIVKNIIKKTKKKNS